MKAPRELEDLDSYVTGILSRPRMLTMTTNMTTMDMIIIALLLYVLLLYVGLLLLLSLLLLLLPLFILLSMKESLKPWVRKPASAKFRNCEGLRSRKNKSTKELGLKARKPYASFRK